MIRNGEKIDFSDYCKERKDPNPNQLKLLLEEVDVKCPMPGCGKSLVNDINGRIYNQYEIAHIFPNRPNEFQKIHLKDVQVDGDNSESLANKIALCRNCHKIYDTNTNEVSYYQLLDIKRNLSNNLKAKKLISIESLEEDIAKAIEKLVHLNEVELDKAGHLEYNALNVADKVKEDIVLRMDIEDRVIRYFNFIKQVFKNLDSSGTKFDLICVSVKKIYLKLKLENLSQSDIFEKLTDWFESKTQESRTVCEIMTSFFVQNCDVYEVSK